MEKRKYGQLGLAERIEIYRLHADGKSQRGIAAALGRSAATISRELKRNSKASKQWAGGYDPQRAQPLMLRRHARGRAHKLERQPELRKKVLQHLAAGMVARADCRAHGPGTGQRPHQLRIHLPLYILAQWVLPRNPASLVASSKISSRKASAQWPTASILERVSIHDRPAVVETRTRSGDWEADLMSFSKPGQFLLVVQERRSRRALLMRQKARTAQSVADNLSALLQALPARVCQSITFDNGTEFSKHYLLSRRFGIQTWFCDTHSPWQKGGIENAIGRLRRLLPRNTDLDALPAHRLALCLQRYNDTPRKCLGFKTPNEVFLEHTVALQT